MKRFCEVFNGGEISEDLFGRTDILKVANGCRSMKNFLPNIQGTAVFRGGFKFVQTVKTQNQRTLLVDFTFTQEDACTIEIGNGYMRFFKDGAALLKNGVQVELVSPYSATDLFDSSGCVLLKKCQSGDTVYLFHEKYPVQRLFRETDGTFTLSAVDYAQYGGFMDMNREKEQRIYASAATGNGITLTANTAIFKAEQVGGLIYIENIHFEDIYTWSEGKTVTAGQKIKSSDCLYTAVAAGTTGASKPTHTEGTGTDGAVSWVYHDAGYGICKITAVAANGLTCTADVLVDLPVDVVGSSKSTWKFKFGAWSAAQGYPSNGCFFRERLVMGRGRRVWLSWIDDYEDFSEKDVATISYETGFSSSISSGQTLGDIQWLTPINKLIIGTTTNLCAFGEADNQNVLSVYNCASEEQTTNSNRRVDPVKIGQRVLFASLSGKEIHTLEYDDNIGQYDSDTLCRFARHINQNGIIKMVHQEEPFDLIYCLKEDGKISVLMYDPVQRGLCWVGVETNGVVESVSLEGQSVVAVVKRIKIIDNVEVLTRNVEYLQNPFQEYFGKTIADFSSKKEFETAQKEFLAQYQKELVYSDAAVVLKFQTATNVISSGVDHLAGRTVSVLADGSYEEKIVAQDGEGHYGFTLDEPAKTVVVGLPYRGVLIPTKIAQDTTAGNNAVDIKRITNISVRLWNSLGGRYSDGNGKYFNIIERTGGDAFSAAVPLFTGQTDFKSFVGDFEREPDVIIDQPYPFPFCVQSIVYDYE